MAIIWKKVSEHPLPEGDGVKQFLLMWPNERCHVATSPNLRMFSDVIKWAEINLPEPDKEPEIELWSVWQDELNHMHILSEIGALGYLFWDVKKHRTFVLLKDEILKQFKPRPDLEVLAPAVIKSDSAKSGHVLDVAMYPKEILNMSKRHLHQWPSSLSAMIIVPKGGV